MTQPSMNNLKKAFKTLKDGYKESPSELERDGIIQRFEYTLELCWKTSKKVMEADGSQISGSPKEIFRELANIDWIDSAEPWFEYLKKRNEASHIYNEVVAQSIFKVIPDFIKSSEKLITILESKNI